MKCKWLKLKLGMIVTAVTLATASMAMGMDLATLDVYASPFGVMQVAGIEDVDFPAFERAEQLVGARLGRYIGMKHSTATPFELRIAEAASKPNVKPEQEFTSAEEVISPETEEEYSSPAEEVIESTAEKKEKIEIELIGVSEVVCGGMSTPTLNKIDDTHYSIDVCPDALIYLDYHISDDNYNILTKSNGISVYTAGTDVVAIETATEVTSAELKLAVVKYMTLEKADCNNIYLSINVIPAEVFHTVDVPRPQVDHEGGSNTQTQPVIDAPADGSYCDDIAAQVLADINAERASLGLTEYVYYDYTEQIARLRAEQITRHYGHTFIYVLYDTNLGGENICKVTCYSGKSIVDLISEGFKASPAHYLNMIDCELVACAVSVYYKDGTYYCAEEFSYNTEPFNVIWEWELEE